MNKFLKDSLDMIAKVIAYYRDNGLKGERFAKMVDRIGFEAEENFLCGGNESSIVEEVRT